MVRKITKKKSMVFDKLFSLFKKKEVPNEIELFLQSKDQKVIEKKTVDFCEKCNEDTHGKNLCDKCQAYVDYLERKKLEEERAKEDLKIRAWVKKRDSFLEGNNGR